ncbi:DUF4232 domain-containing protein [Actinoplanes sp. NPDC051494]|uniref:DUF4232 domain-containing protein n=1 Tax=Actinoplanes sp. NPDC051494 TaxID=3363907 RepID=UPI0037B63DD7
MTRLPAALLLLVVLVAGCARAEDRGGRPIATPPTASVSPPVTCGPAGLRMELGDADAAMGLRVLGLTLITCGHRPYEVNGRPSVRTLDEHRSTLDITILDGVSEITGALDTIDGAPRRFTLRPGEQAVATLAWRNTYDDIREPPVTVATIEVAPAAGGPAQLLTPDGGLDLGSTGRLGVSAWRVTSGRTAQPGSSR